MPIDEDVETFHHRPFGGSGRRLWLPVLDHSPTLVLGSSQSEDGIDRVRLDQEGVAVARRRTGGGAVLVSADDVVWFDVVIDEGDRLWTTDVGRSFDWLGEAVRHALLNLGIETERHGGRLIRSSWSDRVCFAGLGPGELTVDGHKLVGMSQRRTRTAARLQVAIVRRWDPARHHRFFLNSTPGTEADVARLPSDLERAAIGIDEAAGREIAPAEIIDAVTQTLARQR